MDNLLIEQQVLINNWNLIEDVPKENVPCLCLGHNKTPFICYYVRGVWLRSTHSKRITGLTHWMYIPELLESHTNGTTSVDESESSNTCCP